MIQTSPGTGVQCSHTYFNIILNKKQRLLPWLIPELQVGNILYAYIDAQLHNAIQALPQ